MKLRSNEPFWLVKNGLINSYPSVDGDLSADILIVGSGITGSLIAYECIKNGYKTILIDRREIANGSTSATTSMLQYEIDKPLYELIELIGEEQAVASYRACFDSIDKLEKICSKIKSGAGFEKKKSLYFAAYKKDVAWLEREFEVRKAHGFPVKWLEADEIKRRFSISNTFGGILSDQGGSVDAFCLAHELLAYCSRKGLAVYDKTSIKRFDHKRSGVVAETDRGHKIKAKKLIFCNGFESTEIIKEKFVDLLSTYAIVSEVSDKIPKKLRDLVVWNTADPYIYLRTTDDGRILIGGEDEDFVDTEKRDELIEKKVKKLEKQFEKIMPDFDLIPDFGWAGTFGETKDGLPYIGPHKDFPSTYFVLGFGGNGITFSVVGMEMVTCWLKGKNHPLDEPFKFGR